MIHDKILSVSIALHSYRSRGAMDERIGLLIQRLWIRVPMRVNFLKLLIEAIFRFLSTAVKYAFDFVNFSLQANQF